MDNNFVVSIPKDLKKVKSKLFFGLTKRQIIGFGIALLIALPLFLLLKDFSIDTAMLVFFLAAFPFIFGTIYTKNGLVSETWIKLFIEYKYLNSQNRYFKVSKKNLKVAIERNMINGGKHKTKFISSVREVN